MNMISSIIWLICIVIFVPGVSKCENVKSITVATYNVWNIMFNWNVRKFRIAGMIRESDADVIAFQEIRADSYQDFPITQLDELQELVPNYRWQHFAVAHRVERAKDTYISGWDVEGIGVLSRLPIVRHEVQNLSKSHGPDTNDRVVLHVQVLLDQAYNPDTAQTVSVSVVHFSYDRQQQCNNALEVYQYLSDRSQKKTIVMGDFNIYKNFESPIGIFTQQKYTSAAGSCHNVQPPNSDDGDLYVLHYDDAWPVANPSQNGFTFSNMPSPGMESRPDRILTSKAAFRVREAKVMGDGSIYKDKFFYHIIWSRYESILSTALDSYNGQTGRSCVHDCGPHASCRCGICVGGGDKNACMVPHCQECNTTTFITVLVFVVITTLVTVQLIFGALQVLLTMNKRSQVNRPKKNIMDHICLCDQELYTNMSTKMRRLKRHRFCKIWPILRLPPMLLVIVSVFMIFMLVEFALFAFKDSINDVYSIIPEELNPSDHLLFYTTLDIKVDQ